MSDDRILLPAAPPGGGFLVLNSAQLSCLDLLCLIRRTYPHTRIVANQPIPTIGVGRREVMVRR